MSVSMRSLVKVGLLHILSGNAGMVAYTWRELQTVEDVRVSGEAFCPQMDVSVTRVGRCLLFDFIATSPGSILLCVSSEDTSDHNRDVSSLGLLVSSLLIGAPSQNLNVNAVTMCEYQKFVRVVIN